MGVIEGDDVFYPTTPGRLNLRLNASMAVMQREQASAAPPRAETIEELFAALESPLLNYALRLAGELSVAEDIVQEAFMKLHAQFEQVREPRRWLYRAVHNLALNHRRVIGQYLLQVNYQVPTPAQAQSAMVRGVEASEVNLQRGFVTVQSDPRLQVTVETAPSALQPAEWQSIPRVAAGIAGDLGEFCISIG